MRFPLECVISLTGDLGKINSLLDDCTSASHTEVFHLSGGSSLGSGNAAIPATTFIAGAVPKLSKVKEISVVKETETGSLAFSRLTTNFALSSFGFPAIPIQGRLLIKRASL